MIYLDYAATSPVYPQIISKLSDILNHFFYNPSAKYKPGVQTKTFYEKQREEIAKILNTDPNNIIFTSSATESNNLILKGLNYKKRNKIVMWGLEHKSNIAQIPFLENLGVKTVLLNKSPIDINELIDLLDSKTKAVCIMSVNSETGEITNISKIAEAVKKKDPDILVISDLVQSYAKIETDLSNIDLASFSSHKIGGLRGIGGLFVKNKNIITPILHGGGQESGIRSSTENVLGAYSFVEASKITKSLFSKKMEHLKNLKAILIDFCKRNKFSINSPTHSVPYIINFSTNKLPSEVLINYLSEQNIYVSSGSACSKGSISHVLKAMDIPDISKQTALRISLHPDNTAEDIEILTKEIENAIRLFSL